MGDKSYGAFQTKMQWNKGCGKSISNHTRRLGWVSNKPESAQNHSYPQCFLQLAFLYKTPEDELQYLTVQCFSQRARVGLWKLEGSEVQGFTFSLFEHLLLTVIPKEQRGKREQLCVVNGDGSALSQRALFLAY